MKKFLKIALLAISALSLTSCGLLRTATQLPGRTLQSVARTIGLGLEVSEEVEVEQKAEKAPVKPGR